MSEEALHLGLTHLQAAEFLYEVACSRTWNTPSSMRSRTRWPTAACCRSDGGGAPRAYREAIEALYADRRTEQVERLAHHALRGEVWDPALRYYRQAAGKAMARSAHREAVGHFEQALSTLPHLPEQRHTREQAIDLRLALRTALLPSRDLGRILVGLREAEALAAALDDPVGWAEISAICQTIPTSWARLTRPSPLPIAPSHSPRPAGMLSCTGWRTNSLGRAYRAQGDYRRAIALLSGRPWRSSTEARRHERFGQLPACRALPCLPRLVPCRVGHVRRGQSPRGEGLRIAESGCAPGSLMYASLGIGQLALRQGDLPGPSPCSNAPSASVRRRGPSGLVPLDRWALGAAYTLDGRVADAVPLLTQALEQSCDGHRRLSGAL